MGSICYNWAPYSERVFWGRLPMSIGFMAISAAVVADGVDARAVSGWLLYLSLGSGVASPIYWYLSESLGRGDLRLYVLVQLYSMVPLPRIIGLFPQFRYRVGGTLPW